MMDESMKDILGAMCEVIANDPTEGSLVKVKDVFVKFGEDVAQLSPSELNDKGVLYFFEDSPSDEVLSSFVTGVLSRIINFNTEGTQPDLTKATVTFTFEKPLTLKMDDFSGAGKAYGKTVDIETSEDFKTVKSYKSHWEYEPVKMKTTAASIGSFISPNSGGTAMMTGYMAGFIQSDDNMNGSDVLPLVAPFSEEFFDDDKFLLDMVNRISKQAHEQRPELDLSKALLTIMFRKSPMELLTHTTYSGGNKADMIHICAQSNEAGEYGIVHKFFVNRTELNDMEDLFGAKAFQ